MRIVLLNKKFKLPACFVLTGLLAFFSVPDSAHAVVGQAEQYDFFEQDKLNDFHSNLVNEEEKRRMQSSDEMRDQLRQKSLELKNSTGEEKEVVDAEVENLKKQLLSLPKRDR